MIHFKAKIIYQISSYWLKIHTINMLN